MIPQETVDAIMNAAVIEDVVGDYVELKKSGSALRGLSPFTNEKTLVLRPACQGHFQVLFEWQRREPGDVFDGTREGQLPGGTPNAGPQVQH